MNISNYDKSIESDFANTKTYADVLLSPVLPTRLLITSGNGTMLTAILYLSGMDKTLADLLSKLLDINVAACYWLSYLLVLGSLLVINFVFLFIETRDCLSDSNDWHRVKNVIFQERPNYNFSTGKKELTKTPLYIFICFGLLILFSFLSSIDMMILTPLEMFTTKGHSEYIFRYSSGVFYGTFVISNIPPYLLFLMKILLSRAMSIVKQRIR